VTRTTPLALLEDLEGAGVRVDDLWDLVNGRMQYRAGIPVLLDWLANLESRVDATHRPSVREGLIRALSVPAARPVAAAEMVRQFQDADDSSGLGLRWVAGNALSVVADDAIFDDLERLARDASYGKARQMVVLALGRSKHPRAVPLLIDLLADDEVAAHALMALGRLRAPQSRSSVESMLSHSSPLVRREAKKTIARLST
jgi:hypothetical protein